MYPAVARFCRALGFPLAVLPAQCCIRALLRSWAPCVVHYVDLHCRTRRQAPCPVPPQSKVVFVRWLKTRGSSEPYTACRGTPNRMSIVAISAFGVLPTTALLAFKSKRTPSARRQPNPGTHLCAECRKLSVPPKRVGVIPPLLRNQNSTKARERSYGRAA